MERTAEAPAGAFPIESYNVDLVRECGQSTVMTDIHIHFNAGDFTEHLIKILFREATWPRLQTLTVCVAPRTGWVEDHIHSLLEFIDRHKNMNSLRINHCYSQTTNNLAALSSYPTKQTSDPVVPGRETDECCLLTFEGPHATAMKLLELTDAGKAFCCLDLHVPTMKQTAALVKVIEKAPARETLVRLRIMLYDQSAIRRDPEFIKDLAEACPRLRTLIVLDGRGRFRDCSSRLYELRKHSRGTSRPPSSA